jgi:hypothetical protein
MKFFINCVRIQCCNRTNCKRGVAPPTLKTFDLRFSFTFRATAVSMAYATPYKEDLPMFRSIRICIIEAFTAITSCFTTVRLLAETAEQTAEHFKAESLADLKDGK